MAVTTPGPGTFVRLKLRLTANGLRGQTWRVVLFVLGVVLAAGAATGGYAIFAVPGLLGEADAARTLAVLGGAGLVLGWLFLPLVFFGVDESLDPARFALLPLPRRTIVTGLLAASTAGVPAVATLGATAGTVHAAAALGGPAAGLAQALGVVLGVALCAAVSRSVTSAFATALRSRRARDTATVLFAATAGLLGPLQFLALAGAQNANWDRVADVAAVVAWTPLGAPYALGADVVAGRAWAVPLRVLIVAATLGLLLWWWSATLERAMLGVAGGGRGTGGAAETRTPVARLLLRGLPRTPFGALTTREARYWWRESRRRASLITFAVVGVFLPVMLTVTGGGAGGVLLFVGALAAVNLSNQFGFEGSAYAANVVAGVPGRLELWSRTAGYSLYVLPLLLVVAVVAGGVSGRPGSIPALAGTLLAAYGIGLAVVLPLSVRAAYALPDTQNPFAVSSGGGLAKGMLTFAAMLATVVATAPLQVAAYLWEDAWRWLGLPVGLAYGGLAYVLGSRLAGDLLDRRMPEVLAAVTPNR